MSIYRQKPQYTPRPSLLHRLLQALFILLLLAGLASALFLFFFRGYVVDTPDGPRLELPFLAKREKSAAVFSNDPAVTLPDAAEPSALLQPLHAVRLSTEVILDGTAQKEMEKAGCNAVVFDMRDENGALQYVSSLPLAIESGASAATPGLNDAILAMNQNPELYTIARVSCFPDPKLAQVKPELCLLRPSGAPWRDESSTPWLSPNQDAVQQYLLQICEELSDLGFDEVLLTSCAYPTNGPLSQLYGSEDESIEALSVTVEDFYGEVRRVLEAKSTRLSILWEPSPTNNQNQSFSGQNLEAIALTADRIWLNGDHDAAVSVFSSRGLSYANLPFVCVISKSGNFSYSWAVL